MDPINSSKEKLSSTFWIFLGLSFLFVSLGAPTISPFLGIVAASLGYALFWMASFAIEQKRRFWLALAWFASVQAVQLSWMTSTVYMGLLFWFVYLFLLVGMGVQFGLFTTFIRLPLGGGQIAGLAGFWTLMEWARLFFLTGFTWNPVGLALAGNSFSIQFSALFGIYGLCFWVMWVNLFALKAFLETSSLLPKMIQESVFGCASIPQFRSAKTAPISNRGPFLRWLRLIKILGAGFAKNRFLNHFRYNRASLYPAGKKWVLWAAFAIVPYFYGTVQKLVVGPRLKTSSEIKVALIQTGLLPEQRDQLPFQTNAHIHPLIQWDRILTHLSTAKEERFDLIVLPEAAVSGGAKFTRYPLNSVQAIWQKHFGTGSPKVDFPLLSASFAKEVDEWNVSNSFWVQSLANHYGAQIVIGLDDWEEEAQYNAAFHFTPHCDYVERYEKQILIPGGEYIPLRHWKWVSRFFAEKMGVGASFKSGHASKVFFGNLPVGIFICLEETYSHLVREVRRAGAEIFVSISNDVWFPKTRLPWHHFDHGRIRAAEHGIWLLRSCNTGVTAAIDCFGQPIQIFPVSEESAGALIVKIPVQTYSTLYTYIGNWPIILASGAFFSFLAVRRLRRKKKLP